MSRHREPSKLFEVVVMRSAITWDEPHARASDADGVAAIVKEAMSKPFTRIEILDVSHWNSPDACSVTMTADCPRME